MHTNQENKHFKFEETTMRITRAQAKALGISEALPPLHPASKQDEKLVLNFKRAASDENKPAISTAACRQHKKRAVLEDVTNIICKNSYATFTNAPKLQGKTRSKKRNAKVVPAILGEKPEVEEERKEDIPNKITIKAKEESRSSEISIIHMGIQTNKGVSITESRVANLAQMKQNHNKHVDP